MSKISLDRLEKALGTLKQGYKLNPSELERDGLIIRFRNSLELCMKTARKVLTNTGIQADTPKNVINELARLDWIKNRESWIDYINKKNETNSSYDTKVAKLIFSVIRKFIEDSESLLIVLKEKINYLETKREL